MAVIQQLAHSFWRRKEKTPKPTTFNDEDDEEDSEEEEELRKIRNCLLQQAQNSTESTSTSTATPESSTKRPRSRFSRWDRRRRFRSQKGQEEEKLKKRSRSLISSFFADAANAFSPTSASSRPTSTENGRAVENKKTPSDKNMASSSSAASRHRVAESARISVASSSPSFVVQPQTNTLPFAAKSSRTSSASNVQAFVAKFSGKASAFVAPMPASDASGDADRRSSLAAVAQPNDCTASAKPPLDSRTLPSSMLKSLIDSKNLLNKKEGAGAIKESTDSSQTLEEQDGEVKSNSGGTNLKHENTVVHVDTAGMAAAGVASGAAVATSSVTSPSPLTTPTTPGLPPSARKMEIVKLTEHLIDAITCSDYATYSKLCDVNMTCFEPEALGNLIEGLEFHKFYFDSSPGGGTSTQSSLKNVRSTILNPHVHLLGDDAACIAYVRLTQWIDKTGITSSRRCEETRIWHKRDGQWHCVHFHRSTSPSSVFPSMFEATIGTTNSVLNTPR